MSVAPRVLVTGAGGFIGSHVVETFVRQGAQVRAFLRYSSRPGRGDLDDVPSGIAAEVEIVSGDLRDNDAVHRAVRGMEIVLHLGAVVPIPYSLENPLDVIQTNVLGTAHVVLACLRNDVRRLVVTSTSEVYGTAQSLPIAETHRLRPQSPYAASKVGADALATAAFTAYGLPVVVLRPFNTYGPRQSARAIVPTILAQALWREGPVRLGALTPARDFTFATDTAAAFWRAAITPGIDGEIIQLGCGEAETVAGLVQRIGRLVGRTLEVVCEEKRLRPAPSEIECLLSDPRKAAESLGWKATVALDEGLLRTMEWMRCHPERFAPDQYGF